jgi:hypothetical protein
MPGSIMQLFSACTNQLSDTHPRFSTNSVCISAIWPVGPHRASYRFAAPIAQGKLSRENFQKKVLANLYSVSRICTAA